MNTKYEVGNEVWALDSIQLKTLEINRASLNRKDPTTSGTTIIGPLTILSITIDAGGVTYRTNYDITYPEAKLHPSFDAVATIIKEKIATKNKGN